MFSCDTVCGGCVHKVSCTVSICFDLFPCLKPLLTSFKRFLLHMLGTVSCVLVSANLHVSVYCTHVLQLSEQFLTVSREKELLEEQVTQVSLLD